MLLRPRVGLHGHPPCRHYGCQGLQQWHCHPMPSVRRQMPSPSPTAAAAAAAAEGADATRAAEAPAPGAQQPAKAAGSAAEAAAAQPVPAGEGAVHAAAPGAQAVTNRRRRRAAARAAAEQQATAEQQLSGKQDTRVEPVCRWPRLYAAATGRGGGSADGAQHLQQLLGRRRNSSSKQQQQQQQQLLLGSPSGIQQALTITACPPECGTARRAGGTPQQDASAPLQRQSCAGGTVRDSGGAPAEGSGGGTAGAAGSTGPRGWCQFPVRMPAVPLYHLLASSPDDLRPLPVSNEEGIRGGSGSGDGGGSGDGDGGGGGDGSMRDGELGAGRGAQDTSGGNGNVAGVSGTYAGLWESDELLLAQGMAGGGEEARRGQGPWGSVEGRWFNRELNGELRADAPPREARDTGAAAGAARAAARVAVRAAAGAAEAGLQELQLPLGCRVLLVTDAAALGPAVRWLRDSMCSTSADQRSTGGTEGTGGRDGGPQSDHPGGRVAAGGDRLLSIDMEWRPTFAKGERPSRLALLQVATSTRCLLVHFSQMGRPTAAQLRPLVQLLAGQSVGAQTQSVGCLEGEVGSVGGESVDGGLESVDGGPGVDGIVTMGWSALEQQLLWNALGWGQQQQEQQPQKQEQGQHQHQQGQRQQQQQQQEQHDEGVALAPGHVSSGHRAPTFHPTADGSEYDASIAGADAAAAGDDSAAASARLLGRLIDVQEVAKAAGCPRVGLEGLVRQVLGAKEFKKSGRVSRSNWDKPLTKPMMHYAALDGLLPGLLLRQLRLLHATQHSCPCCGQAYFGPTLATSISCQHPGCRSGGYLVMQPYLSHAQFMRHEPVYAWTHQTCSCCERTYFLRGDRRPLQALLQEAEAGQGKAVHKARR